MANSYLTRKERHFIQRVISKALDTTEGNPAEMEALLAAKSLVISLETLASLRTEWEERLKDEPDGALH